MLEPGPETLSALHSSPPVAAVVLGFGGTFQAQAIA